LSALQADLTRPYRSLRRLEARLSWNPSLEPGCPDAVGADAIETLIVPRARDLGDFEVRRALPAPKRQMVGPFIFFDQAGPAEFLTGQGVDVRPHPHIGLATVTYLYRGEFQHRDSLGSNQIIHPGALNWMVAGRGVTHSERTSAAPRAAQPVRHPDLGRPARGAGGRRTEFRAPRQGCAADARSRRRTATAHPRRRLRSARARQRVLRDLLRRRRARCGRALAVTGRSRGPWGLHCRRRGHGCRPNVRGGPITIGAGEAGARLLLLGGATLSGPRYIWWNFVASSRERIEAAKEEWRKAEWGKGLFDLPPDDRDEFIPAPSQTVLPTR
jgi:hypothetical protein